MYVPWLVVTVGAVRIETISARYYTGSPGGFMGGGGVVAGEEESTRWRCVGKAQCPSLPPIVGAVESLQKILHLPLSLAHIRLSYHSYRSSSSESMFFVFRPQSYDRPARRRMLLIT